MSLGLTGIVFVDENTQGSKESSKLLTRGRDRSQTQICSLRWISFNGFPMLKVCPAPLNKEKYGNRLMVNCGK